MSARARSNNAAIMNMVRDLISEKGVAELTQIYNLALPRKISEVEVDRVISKMLRSGELYEEGLEKYKPTR